MTRKCILLVLFLSTSFFLNAEEKIGSYFDEYYRALTLSGTVEKPYMSYRAYSTNKWQLDGVEHAWSGKDERTSLFETGDHTIGLTPMSFFQSYNLNSPYGINDGGLWQGKGYNMALSGGISYSSPYVEISFFPEVYFSQNLAFDIQDANGWSGSDFGYPYYGIDNPQRFGDEAFWNYSWGQSQIRFNYKNMTLGFGTENFWIGPATVYSIVQTNNADGYPHIDFGLNKTETKLGDFEFKMWWGILKSSAYYEKVEPETYQDFLTGFTFSWAPVFIPGFTLGIHKTSQVAFDHLSPYFIIAALDPGIISSFNGGVHNGSDDADGRASVTWSWLAPSLGFEFYGELSMEDYIPSFHHLLRRPDHALGFVVGARQNIPLKKYKDRFFVISTEFASLVWSRDYYLNGLGWGGGFYRHLDTNLGYTNRGQVLGAGFGSGGNGQFLSIDYYAPFGMVGIYLDRKKFDDEKMYTSDNIADNNPDWDVPVQFAVGSKGYYLIDDDWSIGADLAYIYDINMAVIKGNTYNGFYAAMSINYRY